MSTGARRGFIEAAEPNSSSTHLDSSREKALHLPIPEPFRVELGRDRQRASRSAEVGFGRGGLLPVSPS